MFCILYFIVIVNLIEYILFNFFFLTINVYKKYLTIFYYILIVSGKYIDMYICLCGVMDSTLVF